MQAEALSIKELKDALEQSSNQEALSSKKQVIDQMQRLIGNCKKSSVQSLPTVAVKFAPNKKCLSHFGDLRNSRFY